MEKIAIYVPNEEATQFLLFQQYYEPFNVIVNAGVFQICNGSARLNFDSKGKLSSIDRSDIIYSVRHLQ